MRIVSLSCGYIFCVFLPVRISFPTLSSVLLSPKQSVYRNMFKASLNPNDLSKKLSVANWMSYIPGPFTTPPTYYQDPEDHSHSFSDVFPQRLVDFSLTLTPLLFIVHACK